MIADMRYGASRLSGVELLTATLVIVICAGTIYEAAIAFGWIAIGVTPGGEARHQGIVLTATALAILAGVVVTIISAGRNRMLPALMPSAAAFMVARFYTFDPYYAPTLRRAADAGLFSPVWVWTLAVVALFLAALALTHPRFAFAGAPVLLLCLFTAYFVYLGH